MGKFKFVETGIKDLVIIEPTVWEDNRGYFMETWNQKDFEEGGVPYKFVQDNQSRSQKGVLRGLHYQKTNPQGKLVRVLQGSVYDVGVDLRSGSSTFGKWYGVVLSAENKRQFYVPEGFAHGFYVMSDSAEFTYKCTRYYDPSDEGGIMWNDPLLDIAWPIDGHMPILSDKDQKFPAFSQSERYFG